MANQERVGKNVRKLREGRNWSLAQLSERLAETGHDLPIDGLSKLERGHRRILLDDLLHLAQVFDVDLNMLVTDPEVMTKERTAKLWEEHQRLMRAKSDAGARYEDEVAAINAQLAAVESTLHDLLEGQPELQALVYRARDGWS